MPACITFGMTSLPVPLASLVVSTCEEAATRGRRLGAQAAAAALGYQAARRQANASLRIIPDSAGPKQPLMGSFAFRGGKDTRFD